MSRIGNRVLTIPANVTVELQDSVVVVKGPKGELSQKIHPLMEVNIDGSEITVKRLNESKESNMLHGTTSSLIENMIIGVSEGYKKELQIQGVGYRANLQGNTLNLSLGYSHPITYTAEEGITIEVPSQTEIIISGIDKQRVGEVAANIRNYRRPEPYKGKGVRYKDEYVRRKEGKTAAKK